MERTDAAEGWSCERVRGLLSDLLDVQRGERPGPCASPLGDAETLAAVERHARECAACQPQLARLAELGLAFAEVPGAAEPDYARLASEARARAARPAAGGVWDCAHVRGQLSDLLDIRRGERPAPGDSPLADPECLAAAERHLEACAGCRTAAEALRETGLAFGEFTAGAEPDFGAWAGKTRTQARYGGYGESVRRAAVADHVTAEAAPRATAPARGWRWGEFAAMSAGSAAAAVFAVAVFLQVAERPALWAPAERSADFAGGGWEPPEKLHDPGALPQAAAVASLPDPREVLPQGLTPFKLYHDNELSVMSVDLSNPNGDVGSAPLKRLDEEMRRRGSLILGESGSLLGAVLLVSAPGAASAELPKGLAVSAIVLNSPADRMGLCRGDYILGLNDLHFSGSDATEALKFLNVLKQLGKGGVAALDIARLFGKQWVIKRRTVKLGEYEN